MKDWMKDTGWPILWFFVAVLSLGWLAYLLILGLQKFTESQANTISKDPKLCAETTDPRYACNGSTMISPPSVSWRLKRVEDAHAVCYILERSFDGHAEAVSCINAPLGAIKKGN